MTTDWQQIVLDRSRSFRHPSRASSVRNLPRSVARIRQTSWTDASSGALGPWGAGQATCHHLPGAFERIGAQSRPSGRTRRPASGKACSAKCGVAVRPPRGGNTPRVGYWTAGKQAGPVTAPVEPALLFGTLLLYCRRTLLPKRGMYIYV